MNRAELIEIIGNGENSGVEFKLDDIRPEQLAKEIVALANLKGGYILLGVADDKTITGITRSNLSEWVADTVFGRYIHPVILPYYEEVVMDSGYVDARGMGVRTKVIPALKAGGAQSHFDATEDYLKVLVGKASVKTAESITKVSVKRVESVGKAADKATNHVGKTSGKILAAIRDKAEITIPELATIVGVTQRSVERHLQKLQREGLLKRVGGRKLGYWEVVE